uniref:Putative secreted protein n=1 Tax=Anopheles triannulatus TaxID=58253 RepID=A0A2M4B3Q1_9DIPT
MWRDFLARATGSATCLSFGCSQPSSSSSSSCVWLRGVVRWKKGGRPCTPSGRTVFHAIKYETTGDDACFARLRFDVHALRRKEAPRIVATQGLWGQRDRVIPSFDPGSYDFFFLFCFLRSTRCQPRCQQNVDGETVFIEVQY